MCGKNGESDLPAFNTVKDYLGNTLRLFVGRSKSVSSVIPVT